MYPEHFTCERVMAEDPHAPKRNRHVSPRRLPWCYRVCMLILLTLFGLHLLAAGSGEYFSGQQTASGHTGIVSRNGNPLQVGLGAGAALDGSANATWPSTHSTRTHSSALDDAVGAGDALGQDRPVALAAFLVAWRRCAASSASPARPAPCSPASAACGMISIWVTEAAPWRFEVPTQSEPVSPPPMTTTCLPLALIVPRGAARTSSSPASRLFCWVRNSIAKWMPGSSRPGMSRSRGHSAPPDMTHGVEILAQRLRPRRSRRPRCRCGTRRPRPPSGRAPVDQMLFHLEVGDAVAQQAADPVVLLEQGDAVAGAGELLGAGHAGRARSRRPRPSCRSCAPAAAA